MSYREAFGKFANRGRSPILEYGKTGGPNHRHKKPRRIRRREKKGMCPPALEGPGVRISPTIETSHQGRRFAAARANR